MKIKVAMFIIMSMMSSSSALAQAVSTQSTTNSIYIEQVGDNSNITIVQKGQNNRIGSEQNRLILNGNGQILNTTQEGNNNLIQGSIVQADNVSADTTVTGDNNTITYDRGEAASVSGSSETVAVTGSTNNLTFNQGTSASATGATQTITVIGDTNTLTSTINADDVVNTKTIAGDGNNINTFQNGAAGKNIEMILTGNTNTIEVKQTSTNNVDTLKIDSTSSSSTITINQCNSGGPC
jgi:hypothetical protein